MTSKTKAPKPLPDTMTLGGVDELYSAICTFDQHESTVVSFDTRAAFADNIDALRKPAEAYRKWARSRLRELRTPAEQEIAAVKAEIDLTVTRLTDEAAASEAKGKTMSPDQIKLAAQFTHRDAMATAMAKMAAAEAAFEVENDAERAKTIAVALNKSVKLADLVDKDKPDRNTHLTGTMMVLLRPIMDTAA